MNKIGTTSSSLVDGKKQPPTIQHRSHQKMPPSKKKTPLTALSEEPPLKEKSTSSETFPSPEKKESKPIRASSSRTPFLTVEEKRRWLAYILRDTSGQHQGYELSLGDKFKALAEDNKLSGQPEPGQEVSPENQNANNGKHIQELLQSLLATVQPPHLKRFKDKS